MNDYNLNLCDMRFIQSVFGPFTRWFIDVRSSRKNPWNILFVAPLVGVFLAMIWQKNIIALILLGWVVVLALWSVYIDFVCLNRKLVLTEFFSEFRLNFNHEYCDALRLTQIAIQADIDAYAPVAHIVSMKVEFGTRKDLLKRRFGLAKKVFGDDLDGGKGYGAFNWTKSK